MIATLTVDDIYDALLDDERTELDRHLLALRPVPKGIPLPGATIEERVRNLFPRYASKPFGDRHTQMWEWADGIRIDSAPDPFCGYWPRGGAKSTTAEMVTTYLGCEGRRTYGLYVRMTQDMADKSVNNIAALLESDEVARYYPEHAERKVGKFGNAKGWRRNQVRTAGGFTVEAIGLDVAARGIKLEEHRPDFIIFDDIDDALDSPATTQKKVDIITKSILPAGSNNAAVLFIQNLIIGDGIAARLAFGTADFLSRRINSGPFPAVAGLKVEWKPLPGGGRRPVIVAGRATWEGQSLADCQRLIDQIGLGAFMKESQHHVRDKAEGIAVRYDLATNGVDLDDDAARHLCVRGRAFGGIDFGMWRFAFTLWASDANGIVTRIDEVFSQRQTLTDRARLIHDCCAYYGLEPESRLIPLWGDAANPTDIMELNEAFRRGWEVTENGHRRHVVSKLRVVPVAMENKLRKVAIERINDLFARRVLRIRREVGQGEEWRLGMNAASEGTLMTGSRLTWELDNWSFPVPKPGEAQEQDADDDTADGADAIASMRYALMSWWSKVKPKVPSQYEGTAPVEDVAAPFDYKRRKQIERPHMKDLLLTEPTRGSRLPSRGGNRLRMRRGGGED